MNLTEIIIRTDKISKDTLIVLLDSESNVGYLPYTTINGPLDEMSLEYYTKHTKKATIAEIEKAKEYIKERYGYDEVIVRYKLPVNFRERLWPEWSKNKTA